MPNSASENRFFFVLAVALVLFMIVSFALNSRVRRGDFSKPAGTAQKSFPSLSLEAKSIYVYDLREGKALFEKNADHAMPLASLTKIMSALVATSLSHPSAVVKKDGERWSLKNLLDFSLITSSNEGIHSIALASAPLDTFVKDMNAKAKEIGLRSTRFNNETGLDGEEAAGAYGSAKDLSKLMTYILENRPELLEATKDSSSVISSLDNQKYVAKNTNFLVDKMPGALASKTGFTDMAGGNLAFAFDPEIGHQIVVVILGSSQDGRFDDAQKLINATMAYINNQ